MATGYHNANRFEIHGEHGALRFDFERMNELGYYDARSDGRTAGWTTIDVTRGGDGHPYADAWWPDSHGLGYEHGFVNQAADIVTMIGGGEPRSFRCPTSPTRSKTQRVLHAAIQSARNAPPSPSTPPDRRIRDERSQALRAHYMPVGVLTAALQELTPRERRDPDPDLAVEEWLQFAADLGRRQHRALHRAAPQPSPTYRPRPCSTRWPTPSTSVTPSTRSEPSASSTPCDATGVSIADVGYFDDMLHEDAAIRQKKHDFMIAAMDAAVLLGVPGGVRLRRP